MSIPVLIGLVGKRGVGKSTVANFVSTQHNFIELSFATPLKQIGKIFGFSEEQLYGSEKETPHAVWGISGRTFMQKFGTDICRDLVPQYIPEMECGPSGNIWIQLMELELSTFIRGFPVVISDVRFPDEAEAIRKRGGYLIEIRRNRHDDTAYAAHSSETQTIDADFIVYNHGEIGDMLIMISKIVSTLSEKSEFNPRSVNFVLIPDSNK